MITNEQSMCSSGKAGKRPMLIPMKRSRVIPNSGLGGVQGGILHMEQATKLPRCPEMRKVFATNKLEI